MALKCFAERGMRAGVQMETLEHVIDQIVDRFSRDWIKGTPRPLEEYLAEVSPPQRGDLLTELLLMELELRVASDEAPRISDYAGRFPGLEEQVARVFAEFWEISRDLPVA
jgi:hypothetical protein